MKVKPYGSRSGIIPRMLYHTPLGTVLLKEYKTDLNRRAAWMLFLLLLLGIRY